MTHLKPESKATVFAYHAADGNILSLQVTRRCAVTLTDFVQEGLEGRRNVMTRSEEIQKAHYDEILAEYEAHYDDPCSQRYRDLFFHQPMFDGINLSGLKIIEAMCGSGTTTQYLLSHGAQVTGLDISSEAIDSFRKRWPQCEAVCASLTDSKLPAESFDGVVIVGGLHHLHPYLNEAMQEIHRILKPGGYLCFVEPHKGSLPDVVREQWYKRDKLFASNEEAIDLSALKQLFTGRFSFRKEIYSGNLGYLLVLNSMVFRIPLRFKPKYSPLLTHLEKYINSLQGKLLSCYVVCQWQKEA
jgi:SAM-dependent methyltransferase